VFSPTVYVSDDIATKYINKTLFIAYHTCVVKLYYCICHNVMLHSILSPLCRCLNAI